VSAPGRRLFFALWPDEAARAALLEATRAAIAAAGGRAVAAQNLHATLAFLGAVPEQRLDELHHMADQVRRSASARAPLVLQFEWLEHWVRPQILVAVGHATSPAAGALAEALKTATLAAGFSPDLKPFQAHVTLARKVSRAASAPIGEPVAWRFDAFALIESRTEARGPSYSIVHSYPLVEPDNSHGQPRN
jgi:2'-5' RNA ligase